MRNIHELHTLKQLVGRQIQERTWRRVHRLDVEVDDKCIRVRGQTTSYYIKQLTIQAVLDVVGPNISWRIDVDIDVCSRDTYHAASRRVVSSR